MHRFFGFSKKIIALSLFWIYVALNIAFLKEIKVCIENAVIFWSFLFFISFLKKRMFKFEKYQRATLGSSSSDSVATLVKKFGKTFS